MIRDKLIPLGEWLPDLPDYLNEGALEAKNVLPFYKSYGAMRSLDSFTDTLASACLGMIWVQDANSVVDNFCGDANNLYRLSGSTTWDNANGPSGPYTADNWEFVKYGERVIAVNVTDPPQKFDLGVDTDFADLAGSPPSARRIATVRDFVMLGDITGLGTAFVQWSGFNDSEAWATSAATQADRQELLGRGGRIQRIVPGEIATIFREQSIYLAEYIGPPVVFQFDEVERNRGTPSPYSVVWTGGRIWYYGWDGFYVFDGQRSEPIGNNRISRWMSQNAAPDALETMRGVVDRQNRLVMWAFKSSSSETNNNRMIIYNWQADKWSHAEIETEIIGEFVASGLSLDELDSVLPGGIDANSILVDSAQFAGGGLSIAAFDPTHATATFDGPTLPATVDTKETGNEESKRVYVNSIRPQIESLSNNAVTVQVGHRETLKEGVSFTAARGPNTHNNEVNVRLNSRYLRYRLNITGDFSHVHSVVARVNQRKGRR